MTPFKRKIAAILATDVIGYSRLMGQDEESTVERLLLMRELFSDRVTLARGRVFNTAGDAVLAEFPSAVDGLRTAIDIQDAVFRLNAALPEDKQMRFRMGMTIGDVVETDGDLLGDGVNIAARLESIARAGGICVSHNVREAVGNKINCRFEHLGLQRLKNIDQSVSAFHVLAAGDLSNLPSDSAGQPPINRGDRHTQPSTSIRVAVLPLRNASGDPEQEFLSDGMTEDIITDLSQVEALSVTSRNASFRLKGQDLDPLAAASSLGVRYVLDGSVRRHGSKVRIGVQLIDCDAGTHTWAQRYDREFGDIFDLQDDIAKSVASALKVKLGAAELASIEVRPTQNSDAYQLFLMGRAAMLRGWGIGAALRSARQMFLKASELDPNYAEALAGVAQCDAHLFIVGDADINQRDVLDYSARALQLKPDIAEAYAAKGLASYLDGNPDLAIRDFEYAIKCDNENFTASFFCGMAYRDAGKPELGIRSLLRAADLLATDYMALSLVADLYNKKGDQSECHIAAKRALKRVEEELERRPDNAFALSWAAATWVYIGEYDLAEQATRRATALEPDTYGVRYNVGCTYAYMGRREIALEHVRHISETVPRARAWLLGIIGGDSQWDAMRDWAPFQDFLHELQHKADGN